MIVILRINFVSYWLRALFKRCIACQISQFEVS